MRVLMNNAGSVLVALFSKRHFSCQSQTNMIEISAAQFFSIFYFIFSLGFVLQSKEFIGAGLTPENFLSKWLQDTNAEDVQFIQHHVVKSTGTLIIHCCLPLVYLLCYW